MFVAQHYSKLSEAGKTQYDKYSEYARLARRIRGMIDGLGRKLSKAGWA